MSQTGPAHRRTAFLLSAVGELGASMFARRTRSLDLTPSDAGVLRLLHRHPGISQRALADRLGAVPSRVVVLIDSLESRGLVGRARSTTDRRNYALSLTDAGTATMGRLRQLSQQHESELLAPLSDDERATLSGLLTTLAAAHGLDSDVHPGHARS